MISKISPETAHRPINLQGGWPTPRLHPVQAMREAANRVFTAQDINQNLKYGPEHGSGSLRSNIADWLTDVYQQDNQPVTSSQVIVTNGASNGLATILQKFTDPGVTQAIWMVEPTYFLACPIFSDAGFAGRIRGVPEGSDGVDLCYLRKAMEDVEKLEQPASQRLPLKTAKNGYPRIYRHVLYMIPTFSNPSGKTMSVEARTDLIRLAREFDMLVVTDDVYDVLSWAADETEGSTNQLKPVPRLADLDRSLDGMNIYGNAVSNGSFSKIVAPGVRVGWIQGTPDFIKAMGTVGATVSGGCQGHLSSLIVNEMLSNGTIQSHIRDVLIPTYGQRYRTMVSTIKELLYPLGVTISHLDESKSGPSGGFFLYINFPQTGPTAAEIARLALDNYDLRIAPGSLFTVSDDKETLSTRPKGYLHGARLCWAWQEETEIVEGIERLAAAIVDMR